MENRSAPIYSTPSDWTTHAGAYAGVVFMVLLALAAWMISAIVGLVIGGAAILGAVMVELVRRADRLVIYEDGVAREFKLLSTRRVFAEFDSIQDLEVTQSFIERMLGIGTIHINTAGSHGQEIVFKGVPHFEDIEAAIRRKMRPHPVDTAAA